ncbi:MAG: tRNA (adenosine(37)-N6)-threonylcarbamoyltransferase complex dimerization subunit type 1 TsaB [Ignavibacteriae bacterium HGW-Ignavibacteriae-4]|jgi:tRNA threonylcarbamoyl adenosine modification protein YeaZ|nr:MAG: tRNA (adenosine(37)-N6)-threonylcarbamoyltransferase complex dimerization subunit type 1 TsaB [Ignavibacteriae bacterium HGW-Ignavibacteriae-4]
MSEIRILAIESSGINSGIAIGSDKELIYESSLYLKHSHDETLAHQIKQTLELLKMSVDDFTAVAISSGPGSFTGLRVGSAIAKGLTFGNHPKLIDVPTMSAFAVAASEFAISLNIDSIFIIIPSNKDYFFVQEFSQIGEPKSEPILYSREEVKCLNLGSNIVCGTGASEFIENNYQLSGLNRLTPRFILKFAQLKFSKQEFIESEIFKPQYYQDFTPTQKKVDK